MGCVLNASYGLAAIALLSRGVCVNEATADVYTAGDGGIDLERFSDSGTLIRTFPFFGGEGIYDLTHTPRGSIFTASNTLGFLDIRHYNPDPTVAVVFPRLGLPGDLPLIKAGARIAGSSNGALLIGINSFYPTSGANESPATEHSIVDVNLQDGSWSTISRLDPSWGSLAELQLTPSGDIFGRFEDDALRRIGEDGASSALLTSAEDFTIDARNGAVAIRNASNDIVSIDPSTGATTGVLIPDASFGGARVTDFTFGPDDTILVALAGTPFTDRWFRVRSFDLSAGTNEPFASSYNLFGEGFVEYVAPEPASVVCALILSPLLGRRPRR